MPAMSATRVEEQDDEGPGGGGDGPGSQGEGRSSTAGRAPVQSVNNLHETSRKVLPNTPTNTPDSLTSRHRRPVQLVPPGTGQNENSGYHGDGDAGDGEGSSGKNQEEVSAMKGAGPSVISVEIREKRPGQDIMGPVDPDHSLGDPDSGILNRESSFLKTIQKETKKIEKEMGLASSSSSSVRYKRKMKKSIFISYSPDAGFLERKFVVDTVHQLKVNNLAEDIWFDKDEQNTDSPSWFSYRMEAVERCRAAVCFLSSAYFSCPVSANEGKTLMERQKVDLKSVKVYLVMFSQGEDQMVPDGFNHLLPSMVDLTSPENAPLSLAEKSSVVVGSLMMDLEKHACMHQAPQPQPPPYNESTGQFLRKKVCQWSAADLQEWMFQLGIKEFYRQSLAENAVDGFLLMSLTDQDLAQQLCVDSRVVRRKITQQVLATLNKEHKLPENWHLRARTQRSRPGMVYLVYNPTDVRLAQNLKQDLTKRGIQVVHHDKLGQSKEEFLRLNGPQMALATFILVVITEPAISSPFVFHEVLFADWLGKKVVTLMFKNVWANLRPALKAVLGDYPAVDFESQMYAESLDVLEHHVKPPRAVPGIVLEQAYLHKMADGIKPFYTLAGNNSSSNMQHISNPSEVQVFISYQWDVQSRVEDIRRALETGGMPCWIDLGPSMSASAQFKRGHTSLTSLSSRSGHNTSLDGSGDSLTIHIQRSMKAASVVLCCITPKYLQSDNCAKDLRLADSLHKPILPAMLRFCPWPPEGTPPQVRKILARHMPVDISNDKLYKQNLGILVERAKKLVLSR